MKKKLKLFNCLSLLVDIIFLVIIYFPMDMFINHVIEKIFIMFADDIVISFFVLFFSLILLYYSLTLFSIIWHELGHLVFGLKAKLKFVAFNVLSFKFTYDNKKIKVKKEKKLPGTIKGYCNMTIGKGNKYDNKSIKLYYMGGIVFNVIAVIISLLLLLIIENELLDIVLIFNTIINGYLAVHNSIPAVLKSGASTDFLQYLYCLEDDTYFESVSKIYQVNRLLANGAELKDIDRDLFVQPRIINSKSDVLNAQIYVDYLVANEKYEIATEYIIEIREKAQDILSKYDDLLLKTQLINCYFNVNKLDSIKDVWDNELKNYLDVMGKMSPIFVVINYMYYSLIEINNKEKKKYLEQFNRIKDNFNDKNIIKDCVEYIEEIDSKVEK